MADDLFDTVTAARAAADAMLSLARAHVPVKTGHTRDSLAVRVTGSRVELWGSLIGKFLITGTRPHEIHVRNASVLTDGVTFFGTHVHHPGTQPQDFRRQVARDMMPVLHKLGLDSATVAISNIKRRVKAI